jgi:uncharacterized protein (DUF302 family)
MVTVREWEGSGMAQRRVQDPTLRPSAIADPAIVRVAFEYIQGLITIQSSFGPRETMYKLEAAVKAKGMTVFAHIDHAAGATEAGLALRPTEVLVFGNAKGGTPLMQAIQMIGVDLPLKALVWQDAAGDTWLSYSDRNWLATRFGLGHEGQGPVSAMAAALDAVARAATAPNRK